MLTCVLYADKTPTYESFEPLKKKKSTSDNWLKTKTKNRNLLKKLRHKDWTEKAANV